MKLINLQKNNCDVNFSTLLLLEILCVLFFVFIVFLSCLLGRLIVYFKSGVVVFDWERDFFQSIKVGSVAGFILGIGLWIKAWLLQRENKRKPSE